MIKYLFPILITSALCFLPNIARSQTYTSSNRIPQADNSQIGTQVKDLGGNNFGIDGGLQRGQNLFHSFTDFSIPTGGAANFTNPAGNQSIITRVTGNLFSDLNGTLNTNGANFLLINPNGVVFGSGVKLDVGKAFVTSTASGIDFVDAAGRNYNFGTNKAGDARLISIAPNVAFNPARLIMGGSGSKGIENYGTLETKNPNQYIGLIGGNITFNGGQINAPGGRVELGGLSVPGTVGLGGDGNNLSAQFPTNVARGDVYFTSGAKANVAGSGGGDITITARNLEILDASLVRGGIEEGLGTPQAVGGDIKLDATEAIVIAGFDTAIANNVRLNSQGNGGNTNINAGSFSLRDGAQLQSLTIGGGNAGNVNVKAAGTVDIAGTKNGLSSGIFSFVDTGTVGNGGNITIDAGSFSLRDGAQLTASTFGTGNAGNIGIKASGDIALAGTANLVNDQLSNPHSSLILSNSFGVGNAGKISIDNPSGKLALSFSKISNSIGDNNNKNATGKSLGIAINARELELKNNSIITSDLYVTGRAGDIDIKTTGDIAISGNNKDLERITPFNISSIGSSTHGIGDAGKISIDTQGRLSLDSSGFISSGVDKDAQGTSQGIKINARELNLTNLGFISSDTLGKNPGGDIEITAKGTIDVNNSAIQTTSTKSTSTVKVSGSNDILVSSTGEGKAGNISISSERLNIDRGIIFAIGNSDAGGNITLSLSDKLLLINNAQISTTSGAFSDDGGGNGGGNGGNITINSPLIVALPVSNFGSSDITANAFTGSGGKVNIISQGLFGIQYRSIDSPSTNDINASSRFGLSGSVQINTPGIDPGKDTGELPAAPNDASNQISQTCGASQRENKFYITGRGGLPPNASEPQESEALWQDVRQVKTHSAPPANLPQKFAPPAIGWVFEKDGQVRTIAAGAPGGVTGAKVVCPGK